MLPAYLTGDRLVLESVARREARAVPLAGDVILCRVLGKYLLFAPPDDFSVTPHMALNGYWESWTTLALARVLRTGTYAVDVGANLGYFTLLMADGVGPDGRVLAIEPNPRLSALLRRTLQANGFAPRAEVRACAASASRRARRRLVVPAHVWADASLDAGAGEEDEVVSVETTSIDDATRGWPRVDLIKIDAEGSEPSIWQGMSRTLADNADLLVVMEFKPAAYKNAPAFLVRIREAGFALRCIDDAGNVRALSDDEALGGGGDGDWMLFLRRQ